MSQKYQLIEEHFPGWSNDLKKQLDELGVSEVIPFTSRGYEKGWRGYVFKAKIETQIAALKIASSKKVEKETEFLKLINKYKIGPKHIQSTKNIIAMDFLEGNRFVEFIKTSSNTEIKKLVLNFLDQAFELDKIGLDHGQLSYADKHLIVSKNPSIIDFEKSSIEREARNVQAILNYFFLNINGFVAKTLRGKLKIPRLQLEGYAKEYTNAGDRESVYRKIRELIDREHPEQGNPTETNSEYSDHTNNQEESTR